MLCLLFYIAGLFVCFQFLVNSSKIYTILFTLVLIDLWSLSIIWSLSYQFKVYVLLFPVMILAILFLSTSFTIGGIRQVLIYIFNVLSGHQPCFIKLQSLFLIWSPLKKYLEINSKPFVSCSKLFVAFHIILLCLLKEILKKYYIIFFLYLFQTNTLIIFFIYLNHIVFFIILVSLLGIDQKVVEFLSPFFGPYVLAWLGSHQILAHDNKEIEFLHPVDYITNKNKDNYK